MFRLIFLLFLISCQVAKAQNQYQIIPKPVKLVEMQGQFRVDANTKILVTFGDIEQKNTAQWLATQLNLATGLALQISDLTTGIADNAIIFRQTPALWGNEGYQLDVLPNRVTLEGSTDRGNFYALQTLLQLFPPAVYSSQKVEQITWSLPCCHIEDQPRFAYRGMMLDVGRHFFPVPFIKKFIDLLAMHKMNTFHWHLTDDQGWRIEIKKYPLLTQIGARRSKTPLGHYAQNYPMEYDVREYGGFYTQTDIKEVVAYALAKFVTVIPEIEMPGHARAALTAYPELSCDPAKPYEVATEWGVFDDIYCPNEKTFRFLQDVLTEVFTLFPSKYIHIGGDEVPKTAWKNSKFCQDLIKKLKLKDEDDLQRYFVKRIEKFSNSKGKTLIGWDEITDDASPNATIMAWRGTKKGIEAAQKGHDVIMTPTDFCYFDYYQADPTQEPLAIGGYLPLDKVYAYDPAPAELIEQDIKCILGAQANVWTEYMDTPDYVEYMIQPRQAAFAEVVWSAKEAKNYADFVKRLQVHVKRLEFMNVNVAKSLSDLVLSTQVAARGELQVNLKTAGANEKISYSLTPVVEEEGVDYDTKTKTYTTPFLLNDHSILKAQSENGRAIERKILVHKAAGKKYTFANAPTFADSLVLTDGLQGTSPKSKVGWVGIEEKDLEITVDLGENRSIKKVATNFLKIIMDRGFPPTLFEVSVAKDGEDFKQVGSLPVSYDLNGPWKIEPVEINFKTIRARYVRIHAKNAGLCPEKHPNAGQPTWIAIDEIVIE